MKSKNMFAQVFSFVPLLFTLVMLPTLPDVIPAHYDFHFNVDRFGSKYELLLVPVLTIAFQLFWLFMDKWIKKSVGKSIKEEEMQLFWYNKKATQLFWGNVIMTLTFLVLTVWFIHLARTFPVSG